MVCYGIKPSTIIPQNAGNRISEDLNFKISRGAYPGPPQIGPPSASHLFEPPFFISWIRPSSLAYMLTIHDVFSDSYERKRK